VVPACGTLLVLGVSCRVGCSRSSCLLGMSHGVEAPYLEHLTLMLLAGT
jgi:hypothetical protein